MEELPSMATSNLETVLYKKQISKDGVDYLLEWTPIILE